MVTYGRFSIRYFLPTPTPFSPWIGLIASTQLVVVRLETSTRNGEDSSNDLLLKKPFTVCSRLRSAAQAREEAESRFSCRRQCAARCLYKLPGSKCPAPAEGCEASRPRGGHWHTRFGSCAHADVGPAC